MLFPSISNNVNNITSITNKLLCRDDGKTESEICIGFVTFGHDIHFYNISENLARPQMLIVPDHEDSFVPLIDGFLVKANECESVIDRFISLIYKYVHIINCYFYINKLIFTINNVI